MSLQVKSKVVQVMVAGGLAKLVAVNTETLTGLGDIDVTY
jgi:hypothetical protein